MNPRIVRQTCVHMSSCDRWENQLSGCFHGCMVAALNMYINIVTVTNGENQVVNDGCRPWGHFTNLGFVLTSGFANGESRHFGPIPISSSLVKCTLMCIFHINLYFEWYQMRIDMKKNASLLFMQHPISGRWKHFLCWSVFYDATLV